MSLDLLREKGAALDAQALDWRDLVRLRQDAGSPEASFRRARLYQAATLQTDALDLLDPARWPDPGLRLAAGRVRRITRATQLWLHWLLPPDRSALAPDLCQARAGIELDAAQTLRETEGEAVAALAFEVGADVQTLVQLQEPWRRLEASDPAWILDVYRYRPQPAEPLPPRRDVGWPARELHALQRKALARAALDRHLAATPAFADQEVRALQAEVAMRAGQRVARWQASASSLSGLETWLLHEAAQVDTCHRWAACESDPSLRQIWLRLLDYELGQLRLVADLVRRAGSDPAQFLPQPLPRPGAYAALRAFVREVATEFDETAVALPAEVPREVPVSREAGFAQATHEAEPGRPAAYESGHLAVGVP